MWPNLFCQANRILTFATFSALTEPVRAQGRLVNVQQCSKDMRCLVRASICSGKVEVLNRQQLFQLFYKVVGCLFVLFFVNKEAEPFYSRSFLWHHESASITLRF